MLDPDLHKPRLVGILKRIYGDPDLSPLLGFKGGTAAYLFYGLDRFSVDLDFNLLDESQEDFVLNRVGSYLKEFGDLRDQQKKHFTLFCFLSYQKGQHNIKVEISRRAIPGRYELKNYLGISALVMGQEDMFAHKLMAMCDRKRPVNRDLYDVWFFFHKLWPLNEKIVEERSGLTFQQYLKRAIEHVEKIEKRNILNGIGELLTEKQKFWVKDHLKEDLIFRLKLRLQMEEEATAS